jgi:hypothetical protein
MRWPKKGPAAMNGSTVTHLDVAASSMRPATADENLPIARKPCDLGAWQHGRGRR